MPYRNPTTGLCEEAKANEVGLIVNVINDKAVQSRFDGYSDAAASNKKLLTDVFKKGTEQPCLCLCLFLCSLLVICLICSTNKIYRMTLPDVYCLCVKTAFHSLLCAFIDDICAHAYYHIL